MGASQDDALIDMIYGILLGRSSWQGFLAKLVADLPDGKGTFFMHDKRKGRGAFALSSGIEANGMTAYADYYCGLNVWMPVVAGRPVGEGVFDHGLVPREMLHRTEYYNEFLVPNGMLSSSGVTIERDGTVAFMLTTLSARFDPVETERMARRLEALAPTLQQASKFYRRRGGETLLSDMTQTLLDALDMGLIAWHGNFHVAAVSGGAHRFIDEFGLLRSLSGDRANFSDDQATVVLGKMLDRLYDGPRLNTVHIGPLDVTLVRFMDEGVVSLFTGPTVVAVIELSRPYEEALVNMISHHFSLTPAESRALNGLLQGHATADIADAAGRSIETVRSQTKSLYGRLGVSGRADLMRLVLSMQLKPVQNFTGRRAQTS